MKLVTLNLLMLTTLAGCEPMTPERSAQIRAQYVEVMHDDQRQVTCWKYVARGGISCLPDWMLDARQPNSSSRLQEQAHSSTNGTAQFVTERYIL